MHQAATFLLVAQEQPTEPPQQPTVSGSGRLGIEEARRCGKGKAKEMGVKEEGVKSKEGGKRKRKRRREGEEGSLARLARGIGEGIKDISVHNKAKL